MLTVNFSHLGIKNGDVVLDLGCGEGRHAIGLCYELSKVQVVALDLNRKDLMTAKCRHQEFDASAASACLYLQARGERLPFADASFDHIICSEVLEHIPAYQDFISEINRVLKPGGGFCLSVPRFWPEKICWQLSSAYHQVPGGHVRIFKGRKLRQGVEALGFAFKARHYAHALHVPYWWLRCAFWSRGDGFFLLRWYHKLLLWDLMKKPWLTRTLEAALNPLMGKSLVMYFEKPGRLQP